MKTELCWLVHNVIAHPVLGVCNLIGKLFPSVDRFGNWFHDKTTPTGEEEG